MKNVELKNTWSIEVVGDNLFGITGKIETQMPGSVYGTFLEKGLIPDPYYRDNELAVLKLMENDFIFQTTLNLTQEQLESDFIALRFEGIDTLADIYLNDEFLGNAFNMHRIWEFDLSELGRLGDNELKMIFHSPTKYIKEANQIVYTGGAHEAMEGFPHLRKSHCMFGWDWGPRLPDAGLFRPVTLVYGNIARIDSVYITQLHEISSVKEIKSLDYDGEEYIQSCTEKADVTLDFDICLELFDEVLSEETKLRLAVTAPDGDTFFIDDASECDYRITIEDAKLWWPAGFGKQPLYTVSVELVAADGTVLDVWQKRIGLRTMTVNTDDDKWGKCFAHEVNGLKIFAMGADYIPEDNILSRVNEDRTRKLLEDAAAANHNCIRVWGGGYYPEDYFFDACDELGLIVWQDFMFACAQYELDDEFEANITAELVDNIRRIRHHASLGLWCGNNEMETQTLDKAWLPSIKQKYDYIKMYEYIFPKIVAAEDPQTFYWPSSPSAGGNFDNPWNENIGDAHYWDVWHGEKPFTDYRTYFFRYLSEFGFQSFPCIQTVETFTQPSDRNIFSRVMEMHQRNVAANGKIMKYMGATYLYPNEFDTLLYASQLLQADAIRYGVEHFRRHRNRCMGTVVWQLNDIWPVASWASVDYYGRWKALHYAEKRMFAPVLISVEEKGEIDGRPFCIQEPSDIEKSARINISNESIEEVRGTVNWKLCSPDSALLDLGRKDVTVPALSSLWLDKMDFASYDELDINLTYFFEVDGEIVSEGSCIFTAPKHYHFEDPKLELSVVGDEIIVKSYAYAQKVEIDNMLGDLKLSDNYFDMQAGEKRVKVLAGTLEDLRIRSVYNIR